MIRTTENVIIENEDDLNDSFLCYCVMMQFMKIAAEDYIDYNENIVNSIPFITWLNGRKYISNEQMDKLFSIDNLYLQKVLCGGDILFPITYGQGVFSEYKCYQLLSEYISCSKILRQRLYNSVTDKAHAFTDSEFYKNENGISLACIISTEELMVGQHDLHYKNQRDTFKWTYAEMYDYVKNMSVKETDIDIEY